MPFPVTLPYTFGTMSGIVPASDLDANFTALLNGLNGISTGAFPVSAIIVNGGTWNGSPITVAYGGTGLSATPTNGQIPVGNGLAAIQTGNRHPTTLISARIMRGLDIHMMPCLTHLLPQNHSQVGCWILIHASGFLPPLTLLTEICILGMRPHSHGCR